MRNTIFVLSTILLTACSQIKEPPAPVETISFETPVQQLELAGQYKQAAQKYLMMAQSAPTPQREQYQLRATEALLRINQTTNAKSLLNDISITALTPELKTHRKLLLARIALLEGMPKKALQTMPDLEATTPAKLAFQYYEIQAQAYSMLGNYMESTRARIKLELLLVKYTLTDKNQLQKNRELIWNNLQQISAVALDQLRSQTPHDIMAGWMELASINKTTSREPERFETLVMEWKSRYPNHPASESLVNELLKRVQRIQKHPETIALLLPFSGKLTNTANAVRDGFLAAHYQQDNITRTRIRLYDTSKAHQDIQNIYRQAVREGAMFIIGPLDKQAVSRLATIDSLTVPVLALNTIDSNLTVPDKFYQFGLSPEDEARQVAERTSLEGLIRAIVITPEGEWGERIFTAFSERFTQLGGDILEQQTYPLENNDFSNQIRSLLNLDESRQRYRSLKILLNKDVKYEPRRRKDVDFVFMAAFPRQARLITPQLQFHRASDLPVYATSHIYSGKQNRADDRDMNGVIFCDTPWTLSRQYTESDLQQSIKELWPNALAHYSRLYAIGIDAYNILPYLEWLKEAQHERYAGVTGSLNLDPYNKIHRTLKWARFINGKPSVIQQQLIPASLTPGQPLEMIP